jgi:5-methylcytosine-specific restriction endonuclease McrA
MVSALRPAGSTRRWRRLRLAVAWRLATVGSLPCTRCGQAIAYGDTWDLDHILARAQGGTDRPDNLGPAHPRCNRAAQPPRIARPSRSW